MWMAEVRTILDTAAALRLAAAAVGGTNPKAAEALTRKAEELYFNGEAEGGRPTDGQAAVKLWEEEYGGSMHDPEFREKVYDIALRYRKQEEERNAEARKKSEAREKLTAGLRPGAQAAIRRGVRGRPAP